MIPSVTSSTASSMIPGGSSDPSGFSTAAFLSALTGATQRHLDLLAIITNPANTGDPIYMTGKTHDEVAAFFDEEFTGYQAAGDAYEVELRMIADCLETHYERQPGQPGFKFGFECNTSREMTGFWVYAGGGRYGDPEEVTLAAFGEISDSTTDQSATGLAAAVAIAEALDDLYQGLVTQMRNRVVPAE